MGLPTATILAGILNELKETNKLLRQILEQGKRDPWPPQPKRPH